MAPLGDGDFVLTVRAHIADFTGAVDTILTGAEWGRFLRALSELERRRQGAAELEEVPADDLRLRIGSIDRAGHMGISGEIRNRSVREGAELSLRFGPVVFDPSTLPLLVAELSDAASAV